MSKLLAVLATIACLTALACDRSTDLAGMSEAQFASTMADLRRIELNPALDSAARTIARREVLQERDLAPETLEAATRALARDVRRSNEVWSRIDSLVATDSAVSTGGLEEPDTGQ
jgi:hypothetical protein